MKLFQFLKNKIKSFNVSQEQKSIIRESKKTYDTKSAISTQTRTEKLATNIEETLIDGRGVVSESDYNTAGSTDFVTLNDLWTLYFVDREKFALKDIIRNAYIARKLEDFAFIPERVVNIEEIDPADLEEGRMLVSKYKEIQKGVIAGKLESSERNKQRIENFYSAIKEFVKIEMEKGNPNAQSFLDFATDLNDDFQIANNYGGPVLEEYSKFANIPIPVLAIHAILQGGPIKLNVDGSVNRTDFRRIYKSLNSDKKLQSFVCELCGYSVTSKEDGKGGFDIKPMNGLFQPFLPMVVAVMDKVQSDFSMENIFTNADYRRELHELDEKCDAYTEEAIKSGGLNSNISPKISDSADAFIEEIMENGKFAQLNSFVNRRQAQALNLSIRYFAEKMEKEIGEDIIRTYENIYNGLTAETSTIIEGIGLTEEQRNLLTIKSAQFRPKNVDMLREYSSDFAIIANNAVLVHALQDGITHKVIAAIAGKSEEEQEEIRQNVIKQEQEKIAKIIEFNKEVIELVRHKENLRVWQYTIGQIKYLGLSNAEKIFSAKRKEILETRKEDLKNLKKNLNNNERDLKTTLSDKQENLTKRAETVQQIYAERFEQDVNSYLKTVSTTNGGNGIPKKEIDRQIEKAKAEIMKTASQRENGELTVEEIEKIYKLQFARIIKGDNRFRNKGRSQTELAAGDRNIDTAVSAFADVTFGELHAAVGLDGAEATDERVKKINEEVSGLDEEIKRLQGEINKDNAAIEAFESETNRQLVEEEKKLNLATAKIRALDLIGYYKAIYERVVALQKEKSSEQGGEDIVPEAIHEFDDRKSVEAVNSFVASRKEYIEERDATISDNIRRLDEIKVIAFRDFDLVFEQDEKGVGSFKPIDNPTRVNGDIDRSALTFYEAQRQANIYLQLLNVTTDEQKKNLIEQLPEEVREDALDTKFVQDRISKLNDELNVIRKNYAELTPKQQKKYRVDVARVKHYMEKVYLNPEKDYDEQVSEDLEEIEKNLETSYEIKEEASETSEEEHDNEHTERSEERGGDRSKKPEHRQSEVSPEVRRFVEGYVHANLLIDFKNKTPEERLKFIEQNSRFKSLVDNDGNLTVKGDNFIKRQLTHAEERMKKISLTLGERNTPERTRFVAEAANEYISEREDLKDAPTEVRESTRQDVQHDMDRIIESYQIKNEQQEKGKSENKKPVKIEYTAKGCELALKSINKLIEKLEKEIKAQKQAEAATETPVEEPPVTPAEEVVEEAHVETELNPSQKAMLRQAHLSMVHSSISTAIESLTAEQIMSLLESLNVEIDGEEIAGKDPKQITEYLKGKGISLESQKSAIKVQVAFVKNGRVQEDGTIVDSRGRKVEKALYDRYDAGEPARSVEEFNSTSSDRRKKYIARNVIIHALGYKVVSREAVEAGAEHLAQILKEQGLEVTQDNIDKLLNGQIKVPTPEGEIDAVAGHKQQISEQIEQNIPGRDMK